MPIAVEKRTTEDRKYSRHSVSLKATLQGTDLPAVHCEIRDFCDGGLFLSLGGNNKLLSRLEAKINGAVQISFSLPRQGREVPFSIRAQLVRTSSIGVGVAFTSSCKPALTALYSLIQPRSDGTLDTARHRQIPPINKTGIQQQCESKLEQTLSEVLEKFFHTIGSELTQAAHCAENNQLGNLYIEAVSQLTEHRQSIEKSFSSSILSGWNQLGNPGTDKNNLGEVSGELSLLEKDEFEDWLMIADIITKVESNQDNVLAGIEQKLASLADCSVDKSNNPVGPAFICESFCNQLESLNFEHDVKRRIYQVFGESIVPQLEPLYTALDGVLEPVQIVERGRTEPETGVSQADPTVKPQRSEDSVSSGNRGNGGSKQPGLFETFNRFKHFGIVNANLANPSIQAVPGRTAGLETASSPASLSECSTRQILRALLAIKSEQNPGMLPGADSESLRSGILQRVTAPQSISEHEQNHVEIAADFFDSLSENAAALNVGQNFIQKLRVPILNLVIHQPDFLNSQAHPARRVLNLLDRLDIATNERGASANQEIEGVIRDLTHQFTTSSDDDLKNFTAIAKRLERITAPLEKTQTRNIERVQEQCEGRQRTIQARLYVQQLIDKRIAGQSVPKVVITLLDIGWEHLLLLSKLREGTDSPLLRRQISLIDDLLKWLNNSELSQSLPDAGFESCLNFIDEYLSTVCTDVFQRQETLHELTECLIGSGNPFVRKSPEMVVAGKRQSDGETNVENETPRALKEYIKQAHEFNVGDWLIFKLKNAQQEPVKLAWKGESPVTFVFVNRKGQKKIECRLHQLARSLKKGTAQKIESMDIPLTDRSVTALIQDMHEKLIQQVTHDEQTGLINRKEFIKQLQWEIKQYRDDGTNHMVCCFEIDPVRLIENTCGTAAVEALLTLVVGKVNCFLTDWDIFSRLGQNVFGILFKYRLREDGRAACENLRQIVTELNFDWENRDFPLAISVGLVSFSEQIGSVTTILAHADAACLAAKDVGSNRIQIYEEENENLKFKGKIFEWAGQISKVIAENRIFARCQLIIPISPEGPNHSHYEILLGIKNEKGQIVPPDEFIPAAEHLNRMVEIDRWMITHVFDWIESNPTKMETIGGFSINLSGQSLNSEELLEFLKKQLSQRRLSPDQITFEITETFAVSSISLANKFISQIKRYGCKFSLDDFGSGFSSYAYLKNLEVDYLKIDGMFVKDIATNATDYSMVKSMNEIGHSLGMKTIAEYVENNDILDQLKELGVDYAQGYGIEKPGLLTDL